ncbi:MAG: integral rane sensor signal transduction histidine kinase [Herbinix sp.]|jgi:two-component system sensor histidine kinase KdpD|nr:integral rane sensor signal transduction histidine kinase [Herbinix sp.]
MLFHNKLNKKNPDNKIKSKKMIKMILLMFLIMFICTVISIIFFHIKMFESNIVMIYLLGIFLFSYYAEDFIFSFTSSVCAVLLYNFFFTEPYYNLKVNNPSYIITFIVMLIVGFITNMLTNRVKLERQQVEDREKYISSLYYIGKKLLDVKSEEELAKTSAEEIANQLKANVSVKIYGQEHDMICSYFCGKDDFTGEIDQAACNETYQTGSACGHGTNLFSEAIAYYKPIVSQSGVLGTVGISLPDNSVLTQTQSRFIDVIIPQIAVVLDRQDLVKKEQKVQIEMQKERLRADMLRSISHDFRTPLAGIMGLASTARDNYDKINDEVRKNFLQSIYEDADWLSEIVENILQTTRFEAGKVKLNLEEEAAEEIITDAVTHVKKHALNYNIQVKIPEEIILIKVDAILIRQVIVNLLNNAINYSPEGTVITISLYRKEKQVIFEVKDNGPGLLQSDLVGLFDRYHQTSVNLLNRKGMGLGLSLCKTIIQAHGGDITIRNYEPHGAVVTFYITTEEVLQDGAINFSR